MDGGSADRDRFPARARRGRRRDAFPLIMAVVKLQQYVPDSREDALVVPVATATVHRPFSAAEQVRAHSVDALFGLAVLFIFFDETKPDEMLTLSGLGFPFLLFTLGVAIPLS